MSVIKILDTLTANQIAAGEVVERPSSVVKELCENSLDADASVISVSVKNGGITSIEVTDNGCGMDREDIRKAFMRHSTSKLRSVMDFDSITTMGFRGEALASIASVSKIHIKSKRAEDETGYFLDIEAGEIINEGYASCKDGTSISVNSLFFNTPARYKFLKKDFTEASYIADIMERFVMARPEISFILKSDSKEIIHSPGNNDLKSAIFSVYGKETADNIIPLEYEDDNIKIDGFTGSPLISRKNRKRQSVFVNGRYVKSNTVTAAVEEAYKTMLMKGKYPFFVARIFVLPSTIDINVHPQKIQVKFKNENDIFRGIYHCIESAINPNNVNKDIPEKNNEPEPEKQFIPENNNNYEKKVSAEYSQLYFNESDKETNFANEKSDESLIKTYESEKVKNESYTNTESLIENEINFSKMKYIGSVFNTYLMFELNNEIVIIDQHAAHERILFEKLLIMNQNNQIISQNLLSPEIIELTANEMITVSKHKDFFENLGICFEIFGNKSVIVRSVPLGNDRINPADAFKGVLDNISKAQNNSAEKIDDALYSIACKAAVKANDKLSREEVDALISDMQQTVRSSRCPHGRPAYVRIRKYEIEKWFKRIAD